jgi:hypothetical protein
MNNDEFENKLKAVTCALQRIDPTPAWKADILARARQEAIGIPFLRALPPRWLMRTWVVAWIAILAMHFTSPSSPTSEMSLIADVQSGHSDHAKATLASSGIPAFLAFNQRMSLNLELQ